MLRCLGTVRIAVAWCDFAEFYKELAPESSQSPRRDGLDAWPESKLLIGDEDGFVRVADLGGEAIGFVAAVFLRPHEDADRQVVRELGHPRVYVKALAVQTQPLALWSWSRTDGGGGAVGRCVRCASDQLWTLLRPAQYRLHSMNAGWAMTGRTSSLPSSSARACPVDHVLIQNGVVTRAIAAR